MRRALLLTSLLALTACDPEEDLVIDNTNPPLVSTWRANVTGLPARPQLNGTVNIDHYTTHFVLQTTLNGLAQNIQYQWRVWFGTCASRIVGWGPNANPPAYTLIVANANGTGTGAATLNGRLRTDSTYHVRVYTATTVAPIDTVWYGCGEIQPQ
jgi:hypothetical protein